MEGSMTEDLQVYSKGDWIVHRRYGIGKVVGIEKKRLHRKKKRFYKVKTKDSTFWLPVEKAVNSRVGPLPSRQMVREALSVLQKPPRKMSKDHKKRKKKVKKIMSEGSFLATAKLVRDLTARRSEKRLSAPEQRALERLTNHFLETWSIRMGIDEREARGRLLHWITGAEKEPPQPKHSAKPKKLKFPSRWRQRNKLRR
jgi:RNA polymerase-interacting CarD/CdnL/TRCF family regulator